MITPFNFFNNLCICELNFVHTYLAKPTDYPMNNKGRGHHGLIYTVSGTETFHFKDYSIDAVPGSVLYIPKGEKYGITFSGNESVVICIDFELPDYTTGPFITKFTQTNYINSYFLRIEAEWNKKSITYLPECKSLFYKITEILAKQNNLFLPSSKFNKIKQAVEYINANYSNADFKLTSVGERFDLCYRYLEKLFYQKYGTTLKEYVISLKIERAKELLLSEKMLIKDIALSLGYNDIYHFGRLFTIKTGYTPSAYKKKFQQQ